MKGLLLAIALLMISGLKFVSQAQPDAQAGNPVVVDSSLQIADLIVKSKVPVLVDFWAAWCGPCRMLNPIIKELEKEFKGKVLFVKVNVDIHKSLSSYFGINGIPAVFIVKDKVVVKSLPGLQPKAAYTAALNEVLSVPDSSSVPSTAKPAQ